MIPFLKSPKEPTKPALKPLSREQVRDLLMGSPATRQMRLDEGVVANLSTLHEWSYTTEEIYAGLVGDAQYLGLEEVGPIINRLMISLGGFRCHSLEAPNGLWTYEAGRP